MSSIRSRDTEPELLLRKKLWEMGFRYRVNSAKFPGKPDLLFKQHKTVVFVDGEFWHGYDWEKKKNRIKANRDYWIRKIEGNMKRDFSNNEIYKSMGWNVIRFWEREIRNDLSKCLDIVLHILTKNKRSE